MTNDERSLLDDLLEQESGLTGWEIDFLTHMNRYFRDRDLFVAQGDKLRDIARKMRLIE